MLFLTLLLLLLRLVSSQLLSSTPTPIQQSQLFLSTPLPTLSPHLDLRAAPPAAAPAVPIAPAAPPVAPGGAGAAPPAPIPDAPAQVPTITTVMVNTVIGGVPKQVPVVYTQSFVDVPSQGPLPLKGTIGLGKLVAEKTGKGKEKRHAEA